MSPLRRCRVEIEDAVSHPSCPPQTLFFLSFLAGFTVSLLSGGAREFGGKPSAVPAVGLLPPFEALWEPSSSIARTSSSFPCRLSRNRPVHGLRTLLSELVLVSLPARGVLLALARRPARAQVPLLTPPGQRENSPGDLGRPVRFLASTVCVSKLSSLSTRRNR